MTKSTHSSKFPRRLVSFLTFNGFWILVTAITAGAMALGLTRVGPAEWLTTGVVAMVVYMFWIAARLLLCKKLS
jgi:hypothetical protein